MALNLNEGVFLILHLDFSVGVGLCEQVMGPQALPAEGCCQQLCPGGKTAANCNSLVSAVVGNQ